MDSTLTFFGLASMKINTAQGVVVYIDPYYPGDYSQAADIILSSHEHFDHNNIGLVTKKADCRVLRVADTLNADLSHNTFTIKGVQIDPVAAGGNQNHHTDNTNGFVLTFDGISVYHASDTAKIPEMAQLKSRKIDYAFFPIDGEFTMSAKEAMECAKIVGAAHNTPIHWMNADPAAFTGPNLLRIAYGETIVLKKLS